VQESKYYNKYAYGLRYNHERLQNGITELPDSFLYTEDNYYKSWLVWKNPNPKYNDSSFTHLRKMVKLFKSDIILETDLFKRFKEDSLNYEVVLSKFYYTGKRQIIINKRYEDGVVTSIDTTHVARDFLFKN
jgi:hypothetical protein